MASHILNQIKQLFNSATAKSIVTLLSGSLLAQSLPILSSPILSRYYSPDEFGALALFMSILGILGVVVTARYSLAIMLPDSVLESIKLLILSIAIASIISVATYIILSVLKPQLVTFWEGGTEVLSYTGGIALAGFAFGAIQAQNYFFNGQDMYRIISIGKVTQAGVNVIVSIVLIFIPFFEKSNGLIIGQISGWTVAAILLFFNLWVQFKSNITPLWRQNNVNTFAKELVLLAKKYSSYPIHGVPGALADSMALQLPILFFSYMYDKESVGFFSMTIRVTQIPVILLSFTISQIIFRAFTDAIRNKRNSKLLLAKIALLLFFIPIPFVIIVLWYGPEIFTYVFGSQWEMSGRYAQILIIASWIKFIVSPLSSIFAVKNSMKLGAIWQYLYLFTTLCVLGYGLVENLPFDLLLWVYTVHEVVLYLIYFLIIYRVASSSNRIIE